MPLSNCSLIVFNELRFSLQSQVLIVAMQETVNAFLLICCFTSTINIICQVGTISYPKHTFPVQVQHTDFYTAFASIKHGHYWFLCNNGHCYIPNKCLQQKIVVLQTLTVYSCFMYILSKFNVQGIQSH